MASSTNIVGRFRTQLYYLLRHHLSQERRADLKRRITATKKRFRGLHLLIHGKFTAKELVRELASRIPEDFEILMIHSGFDRLLPMYTGSPQDLVNELISFCGPNRTLVMPTFFLGGRYYDPIGYFKMKPFDVVRTVSEMGLTTEILRRKPGARRSLHPTHSVAALGPLAEELTSRHHLGIRLGKNSPFEVMARRRTAIVGIGIEHYRCITQAKSIEDILGDDFPVACKKQTAEVRMIDAEGKELTYPLVIKSFVQPIRASILRSLLRKEELQEWNFHGVPLWVTSAQRVTECLLEAATRGITIYGKGKPAPRAASVLEGSSLSEQACHSSMVYSA